MCLFARARAHPPLIAAPAEACADAENVAACTEGELEGTGVAVVDSVKAIATAVAVGDCESVGLVEADLEVVAVALGVGDGVLETVVVILGVPLDVVLRVVEAVALGVTLDVPVVEDVGDGVGLQSNEA